MIESLKDDDIIRKQGGRFKLAALMQKRWVELMQGSRPLVDPGDMNALDLISKEILEDKITLEVSEVRQREVETSSLDDAE